MIKKSGKGFRDNERKKIQGCLISYKIEGNKE